MLTISGTQVVSRASGHAAIASSAGSRRLISELSADFPWFVDAPIGKLMNVQWPSDDHLYWPDLDVDLSVRSIEHPEEFPLRTRGSNRDLFVAGGSGGL